MFENWLQRLIGWLAPSPNYPVQMALSGLAIPLTPDGIESETLQLLETADLEVLARDYCRSCHTNGYRTSIPCADCGPVRLYAVRELQRRSTEVGS